ncbi:MAG: GAF domain-containing protein, partial [Thermoleophilia bacterium]|nr:GAF domain-containing protein [Thermoleophilia bacterium]
MTSLHALAEAGIQLARANDVERCRVLLEEHTRALTGAATAAACACIGSRRAGLEQPPAPAGAHRFELRDTGDEPRWSVSLTVTDPSAADFERICELLVQQAGVGLECVVERSDLARHELQQHALVEAGKALSSERTLDGVLRRIVEQAMLLTGARYGALGVLDDDGEQLDRFVTVGIDEATHEKIGDLPRGRGILRVLIDDPRPLRLTRLQDHDRSVGFPEHHPPMTTFLGVPIISTAGAAGRLYLTEKAGGEPFTAEDERLAQTLASQAAIAIDNATLNDLLHHTAAALEEASRHKSAFLANMSHELRSPLNTIIGYTRLLQEDPRNLDEEQLEDLELVRGSGEHLLALITDLLDLQKIEAGRVTLLCEDLQLRPMLEAVRASVQPSAQDGVVLVLDADDLADDHIRCDPTRIRQVLLNLLGNALKFTSEGEVRIVARDDDSAIRISVSDTGPGIPEADQARIFESFYQSNAALGRTPNPREGAGLGLAITKLLVELHGGT